MDVTIYHNPRCSKSRQTLALLQENGVEPKVVAYLETPPSAADLRTILDLLGIPARDLLRKKEAKEAGLDDPALTEAEIIAGMVTHPKVIERPIVVVDDAKAALGRPPESVLPLIGK
ncbi:arsenate reductase (glutaredoxin) [Caenispirillum salinarum]|uniref:arsenate reductase (glutaredoxin) n=1 Tax=Caenispirillum salinarum TaxID=859058 RepID=UPI00384DC483